MNASRQTAIVIALLAPFYLNDFASIHVQDWRWWLLIDYVAVKLLPLAIIAWMLHARWMVPGELGIVRQPPASFLVTFVVVTLVAILIDQNGLRLLAGLPGYAPLGGMPPIGNRAVDWIDLTLGLLLVGLVEELVFRACLFHWLRRLSPDPVFIVLVSSAAFGLIHWSGGLHTVLVTAVIGALFMTVYIATRRIAPIVLAHFAVNFVDFAGAVPKSIFQFG